VGCTDKATTHFRSHTRAIWYDNFVWSRYRRGNCAPLGSVENGTDNPTSVKSKFHVGRQYCCITALLLACLVFPRYQKVVGTTFWSLPFICSCMTQLWTLRKDAERAPPSELMFCLANMWRFWMYILVGKTEQQIVIRLRLLRMKLVVLVIKNATRLLRFWMRSNLILRPIALGCAKSAHI
jgi:hypothetical protein